jgi:hypothetical protein
MEDIGIGTVLNMDSYNNHIKEMAEEIVKRNEDKFKPTNFTKPEDLLAQVKGPAKFKADPNAKSSIREKQL